VGVGVAGREGVGVVAATAGEGVVVRVVGAGVGARAGVDWVLRSLPDLPAAVPAALGLWIALCLLGAARWWWCPLRGAGRCLVHRPGACTSHRPSCMSRA
jgi:hypothetical protein